MQPEGERSSTAGKTIAAIMLIGLGLVGLGMTLCGGFFTSVSLFQLVSGEGGEAREFGILFAVTGSGSMVLGGLLGFLTLVAWRRTFKT